MLKSLIKIMLAAIITGCNQQGKKTVILSSPDSIIAKETTVPLKENSGSLSDSSSKDINRFIPANYNLLDSAAGNLNLDSFPDMILVLRKNGEDSTSDVTEHPEKRPLLILTGQPDQSWRMAARTENAVYCVDCGGTMGDPFMDVVIKNGYFSVEHYGGSGWRWTRTVTFSYSKPDRYWFLHKDGHESFHAADPEKIRTKIFSAKDFGKVRLEEFDIYKHLDTGLE